MGPRLEFCIEEIKGFLDAECAEDQSMDCKESKSCHALQGMMMVISNALARVITATLAKSVVLHPPSPFVNIYAALHEPLY